MCSINTLLLLGLISKIKVSTYVVLAEGNERKSNQSKFQFSSYRRGLGFGEYQADPIPPFKM